jgi:hypothetical protein
VHPELPMDGAMDASKDSKPTAEDHTSSAASDLNSNQPSNGSVEPSPQPPSTPSLKVQYPNLVFPIIKGKFAAMEVRKRSPVDSSKEEENDEDDSEPNKKPESKLITVKDNKGQIAKVWTDDEEELQFSTTRWHF